MSQSRPIPVGAWVRVSVGPDTMVAFTYRDPHAGVSARGDVLADPAGEAEIGRLVEAPSRTVRLAGGHFPVEVLRAEEIAALGLPARPPWLEGHPEPGEVPWRTDADLDPVRHAELPNDVQVRFLWVPEVVREDMWVSLHEPAEVSGTRRPAYTGTLLNTSRVRPDFEAGAEVTVVSLPNGNGAMFVSPVMVSNLESWSCECQRCGFDLYPMALEEVMARQFGDQPSVEMVGFTTRCPVCNEAMLVQRRGAEV